MIQWMKIYIIALAALLGLAACQSAPVQDVVSQADVSANAPAPYTLGNGDRLRITVFGEPELSGEYQISGSGVVSMPLIGQVDATGNTVLAFQALLEERYRDGYLREPRISAEVITFRPYYILGEVNDPGEYPYTEALTVMNAVATASGFTYRANRRTVFIRGENEQKESAIRLNPNTLVQPGDTIRVGERLF